MADLAKDYGRWIGLLSIGVFAQSYIGGALIIRQLTEGGLIWVLHDKLWTRKEHRINKAKSTWGLHIPFLTTAVLTDCTWLFGKWVSVGGRIKVKYTWITCKRRSCLWHNKPPSLKRRLVIGMCCGVLKLVSIDTCSARGHRLTLRRKERLCRVLNGFSHSALLMVEDGSSFLPLVVVLFTNVGSLFGSIGVSEQYSL